MASAKAAREPSLSTGAGGAPRAGQPATPPGGAPVGPTGSKTLGNAGCAMDTSRAEVGPTGSKTLGNAGCAMDTSRAEVEGNPQPSDVEMRIREAAHEGRRGDTSRTATGLIPSRPTRIAIGIATRAPQGAIRRTSCHGRVSTCVWRRNGARGATHDGLTLSVTKPDRTGIPR
jgi:hypothetical protein